MVSQISVKDDVVNLDQGEVGIGRNKHELPPDPKLYLFAKDTWTEDRRELLRSI